jgi:UDPglucose--hexose-1-phosphate uridylyltransferase
MIQLLLNQLVIYAIKVGILDRDDQEYAINQLLYVFRLDSFTQIEEAKESDFHELLEQLLAYALRQGLIEADLEPLRDNFEAKIMDCFLPRPAELNRQFRDHYKKGPKIATEWFYRLSKATNYIKTMRVKKNIEYKYSGKYTPLDITINLSKPEKDPKLIALQAGLPSANYPACALCMENVGFYGTLDKAPRSNHRVISLTLNHEKNAWGFQYSPYSYFNEHCIVLKKAHIPMKVDRDTFAELIDFVNQFPHYLIGSNAGLPIVGGSILNHYHFQGGRYDFPIESARVVHHLKRRGVEIEILDWPMSVIRLIGSNENQLLDMAEQVFEAWKKYSNPSLQLFSQTDKPHNTVTPIVKLIGSKYHFYLVLRNNYAPSNRPYGLFHPREEYFHIKKENIGLIEVMGLAVLPGRLKTELDAIRDHLKSPRDLSTDPLLQKHRDWILSLTSIPADPALWEDYLRQEVGKVFELVLEDCGVFQSQDRNEFIRFVEASCY